MKKKISTYIITAVLSCSVLAACSESTPGEAPDTAESYADTSSANAGASAETSTATPESTSDDMPESTDDSDVTDTKTDELVLYDTKPISDAYLSGDTSQLDELQTKILKRAEEVISEVITDDMDDYQKELAIHDYIVINATYDENMLSVFETPSENSDNPYGTLVLHQSICSGYTTTFQMFMDMLEIPCISVKGSDDTDEEHAWNMVLINDEWYHIDVTWDDPVPDRNSGIALHHHFNVTDEHMLDRHVWDTSSTPAANSYADSFIARNLKTMSSWDELDGLINEAIEQKSASLFIEPDESLGVDLSRDDPTNDYDTGEKFSTELLKIFFKYFDTDPDIMVFFKRTAFEDRNVIEVYIASKKMR